MMTINTAAGAENSARMGGMGGISPTDSVSKNIQNQIANAQKRLQELSSKDDMPLEEKMKKRQEIQQEINSLNQQLKQHQIEQRKERQSGGTSMDDMLGGNQGAKTETKGGESGLSQSGMQAIISAGSSIKQAQVQGSVATRLEGRANVLKAEIKQDAGRNNEAKEAELALTEEKAMNATASQVNTLADANRAIEKAAEADRSDKSGKSEKKTKTESEKTDAERQEVKKASEDESDDAVSKAAAQPPQDAITENAAAGAANAANTANAPLSGYKHVDVLL